MPQGPFLAKYGAAYTAHFELFEVDGVDFRVDATFASGDVKIMKDEGAEANTTNLPTDEGTGYSIVLTATEMQAAKVKLYFVDQTATKVWLDTALEVETYGNASAQHAFDLDDSVRGGMTALPNAAAEAAGGLYTRGTGAGQINQDANGRVDTNVEAWNNVALGTTNPLPNAAPNTPSGLNSYGKMLAYFQLLARSDAAITADRATELGEINNNQGSGGGDYAATADSQEATSDALAVVDGIVDDLKLGIILGAAATGTLSTTQATTNLTGYTDDQLIGRIITVTSGSAEGESSDITDYASASGLITFTAMTLAMSNGDTFKIT